MNSGLHGMFSPHALHAPVLKEGVAETDQQAMTVSWAVFGHLERSIARQRDRNGWKGSIYLVGGLELLFHILGIIIPTDSYFSESFKPPASYW